jgi:peptidoglycan lytic transglycosylase
MKSTTRKSIRIQRLAPALAVLAIGTWTAGGMAQAQDDAGNAAAISPAADVHGAKAHRLSPEAKPALDRSGHTRVGKASFYAKMFAGRTMADGTPMQPTGSNAASRTLPLGTTAKVTNLETGKTAVVTIRDRGPYVSGRIVDLSPATARQIGLDQRTGVTKVEVAPIAVPLANGEIKLGDGVLQASNRRDEAGPLGAGERIEAPTGMP